MTIGLLESLRNDRLDLLSDAIDAGTGAGTLKIYDGTRPATGGTVTTLLATITFSNPSVPAAATGGILTFGTFVDETNAPASGTATWARAADSDATFVCDMSVGGPSSGEDIELDNVTISSGTTVSVTSGTITAGNP